MQTSAMQYLYIYFPVTSVTHGHTPHIYMCFCMYPFTKTELRDTFNFVFFLLLSDNHTFDTHQEIAQAFGRKIVDLLTLSQPVCKFLTMTCPSQKILMATRSFSDLRIHNVMCAFVQHVMNTEITVFFFVKMDHVR